MEYSETGDECGAVLAWLRGRAIDEGAAVVVDLPPQFARAAQDGKAHAARTADGRLFLLLKKHIGWKDNFEGTLCADGPIAESELVGAPNGRTYLALPGLGVFEELYVRNGFGAARFEAYFDLN